MVRGMLANDQLVAAACTGRDNPSAEIGRDCNCIICRTTVRHDDIVDIAKRDECRAQRAYAATPEEIEARPRLDRMDRQTGRVGNHRGGSLPPLREPPDAV